MLQHHRVDGGLEAVAVRLAAGLQAQRASPAPRRRRAAPPGRAPGARSCTLVQPSSAELVAHDLRDRQPGDRLVERLLQARGQRGAGHDAVEEQRLGLAVGLRACSVRHDAGVGAQRRPASSAAPASAGRRRPGPRPPASASATPPCRAPPRSTRADVHRQPARRREDVTRRVLAGQALRRAGPAAARRRRPRPASSAPWAAVPRRTVRPAGSAVALMLRPPSSRCCGQLTSSAQARGAIGKPSRARLSR